MPILVIFSEDRLHEIPAIIKGRNETKRSKGVVDRAIDKRRASEALDYDGIMGEMAVEVVFGVPMRRKPSLGGDPGWDFILAGATYDVKATRYINGHVLFKNESEFRAQGVVFSVVGAFSATLVGFCSREKFLTHCRQKDLGQGAGLIMGQEHLLEIGRLLTMHRAFSQPHRGHESGGQ